MTNCQLAFAAFVWPCKQFQRPNIMQKSIIRNRCLQFGMKMCEFRCKWPFLAFMRPSIVYLVQPRFARYHSVYNFRPYSGRKRPFTLKITLFIPICQHCCEKYNFCIILHLFNLFYGPGRISTLFLTVLSTIQGVTLVLLFSLFINEVEFLVLLFLQFINELKLQFCQQNKQIKGLSRGGI